MAVLAVTAAPALAANVTGPTYQGVVSDNIYIGHGLVSTGPYVAPGDVAVTVLDGTRINGRLTVGANARFIDGINDLLSNSALTIDGTVYVSGNVGTYGPVGATSLTLNKGSTLLVGDSFRYSFNGGGDLDTLIVEAGASLGVVYTIGDGTLFSIAGTADDMATLYIARSTRGLGAVTLDTNGGDVFLRNYFGHDVVAQKADDLVIGSGTGGSGVLKAVLGSGNLTYCNSNGGIQFTDIFGSEFRLTGTAHGDIGVYARGDSGSLLFDNGADLTTGDFSLYTGNITLDAAHNITMRNTASFSTVGASKNILFRAGDRIISEDLALRAKNGSAWLTATNNILSTGNLLLEAGADASLTAGKRIQGNGISVLGSDSATIYVEDGDISALAGDITAQGGKASIMAVGGAISATGDVRAVATSGDAVVSSDVSISGGSVQVQADSGQAIIAAQGNLSAGTGGMLAQGKDASIVAVGGAINATGDVRAVATTGDAVVSSDASITGGSVQVQADSGQAVIAVQGDLSAGTGGMLAQGKDASIVAVGGTINATGDVRAVATSGDAVVSSNVSITGGSVQVQADSGQAVIAAQGNLSAGTGGMLAQGKDASIVAVGGTINATGDVRAVATSGDAVVSSDVSITGGSVQVQADSGQAVIVAQGNLSAGTGGMLAQGNDASIVAVGGSINSAGDVRAVATSGDVVVSSDVSITSGSVQVQADSGQAVIAAQGNLSAGSGGMLAQGKDASIVAVGGSISSVGDVRAGAENGGSVVVQANNGNIDIRGATTLKTVDADVVVNARGDITFEGDVSIAVADGGKGGTTLITSDTGGILFGSGFTYTGQTGSLSMAAAQGDVRLDGVSHIDGTAIISGKQAFLSDLSVNGSLHLDASRTFADRLAATAMAVTENGQLKASILKAAEISLSGVGTSVDIATLDATETDTALHLTGTQAWNGTSGVNVRVLNLSGGHVLAVNNQAGNMTVDTLNVSGSGSLYVADSTKKSISTLNAPNASLTFVLPQDSAIGQTIVTVDRANLNGATIGVDGIFGVADPSGRLNLSIGDGLTLLAATNSLEANGINLTIQNANGDVFGLRVDDNQLEYFLKQLSPTTPAYDRLKAYAEGRVASLAFVNQGQEYTAYDGLGSALSATSGPGWRMAAFGGLNGSTTRYKTGSHVNVDGVSMLAGLAAGNDVGVGRLTFGGFFEGGWGNYDTHNSFGNYASVKGKGDTSYYGGGLLGRYDVNAGSLSGMYLDASGRVGRAKADFRTDDIKYNGARANFDSASLYYGLHGGLGYVLNLNEPASLDLSAKFLWTRQEGDTLSVHGDRVRFRSTDSLRSRVGGRFTYAVNDQVAPYVGAYWEQEYDGKTRSTVNGRGIDAPNLKGATGMGELGFSVKPRAVGKASGISLDLAVQGHTGVREGVGGSFQLKYEF